MELYLVRHGDAKSDAEDPKRPLSKKGRNEVSKAGKRLICCNVQVSAIYHSPKLRAQQTAEIIAKYLEPSGGVHEKAGLKPMDDPDELEVEINTAVRPVMFVGHLPHLSRLVSLLVFGDLEIEGPKLNTATTVALLKVERGWNTRWILGPETHK